MLKRLTVINSYDKKLIFVTKICVGTWMASAAVHFLNSGFSIALLFGNMKPLNVEIIGRKENS